MCGFAGLLTRRGQDATATARTMGGALVHRGPDDEGVWADAEAGYAVAFRRLAIVDLSPQGHQPMVSHDGRWILAFNGEVYSLDGLRAAVEAAGAVPWRGHSDTEVLLEAIALWGVEAALAQVEGMFALAVWDRRTRELTLARDRLGEKPLFWARLADGIAFASELPALRRHPQWRGGVDPAVLGLYLKRGWIPAPWTIHPDVWKLPPGHLLTIDANGVPGEPVPFWSLPRIAEAAAARPFQGDETEAAEELERRLRASVRARLHADVPVGAFLSGGIDSSTVVALMQASGGPPVRTFTIGFETTEYDESPFAEAVAAHLGTDHTTLPMRQEDALALVPGLAAVAGEPFADPSLLPTMLLCAATRRHVTVALAGDGGDELFGGYARFADVARRWARRPGPLSVALAGGLAAALPVGAGDRMIGALGRLVGRRRDVTMLARLRRRLETAAADSPARLMALHHTPWRDDLPLAPHADLVPPAERGDGLPRLDDAAQVAMVVEAGTYLPDDLLVKVDRASMAASLEVRAPFLDRGVIDLAYSLPTAFKMDGTVTKKVLRTVLYRHVPQALIDRPKRGFEPPIGQWLRGPLRDWADDLLAPDRLRRQGLVETAAVEALWRSFRSGRTRQALPVWTLVMLQAWLAEQGL